MTHKTYILGNGGFAQEVFEQVVLRDEKANFGGFLIIKQEKAYCISEEGVNLFKHDKNASFILGTSNPVWREKFIDYFTNFYPFNINHFPNISAYNAHVSQTSRMGIGNLFLSFSMLNANSEIGNFNTFNCYSSLHHDCSIGDNNFLHQYSNARSNCKVGSGNILQAGEVLLENMKDNGILSSGVIFYDGASTT